MFRGSTSPLCVFDIGSHQSRALIAQCDEEGNFDPLGFGQRQTLGVVEGLIHNSRLAEETIAATAASAENLAGTKITQAVVGLNNKTLTSHTITLERTLGSAMIDGAICQDLREQAIAEVSAKLPQKGVWNHVHVIPLGFSIDGSEPTDNPEGLYGSTLTAQFHLISAPQAAIENLRKCFLQNGIRVERFVFSPYAAGFAVLENAQRQYGTTLIDMGGDTTSMACFNRGKLQNMAVLPFGGNDVTRDVAHQLRVHEGEAERLKVTNGNLAASFNAANINEAATLFSAASLDQADVNPVIEARVYEIFLAILETLAHPSFARHQNHNLVFTGAAAQLKGMLAYAETTFADHRVRLSAPGPVKGAPDSLAGPGFATLMGLMRYSARVRAQEMGGRSLLSRASLSPRQIPIVKRLFA